MADDLHDAGDDLAKRLRDVGLTCTSKAADRIEQLEAALTRAVAATAAAFEVAAQMVQSTAYTSNGDGRSLEPVSAGLVGMDMHHATIATAIRALATPDQSAALDAVRAEARAQGVREAAQLCQTVADEAKGYGIPQMTMGANTCRDAILAASKKGGA